MAAARSHALVTRLLLLLAIAAAVAGASMIVATCVAGRRVFTGTFARDGASARRFVVEMPAQPLRAGATAGVDLWVDYTGQLALSTEVTLRSAGGAVLYTSSSWSTRGGQVRGSFSRAGSWVVPDAGPWRVVVALTADGSGRFEGGTATLREGVFEGVFPGVATLLLALVLGGVVVARRSAPAPVARR